MNSVLPSRCNLAPIPQTAEKFGPSRFPQTEATFSKGGVKGQSPIIGQIIAYDYDTSSFHGMRNHPITLTSFPLPRHVCS
jgi:hypothetical protein